MERVSIGFLFSEDGKRVALMTRDAEEYNLKAVLNAIGGHIEDGETNYQAMKREFNEEAKLDIDGWEHYASVYRKDVQVDFFRLFSDEIAKVDTVEIDLVKVYYVERLRVFELYPNLDYMIKLALDKTITMAILNQSI